MIYRFDAFECDTEKFELRRNGARVAVEPQVFSIIRFLIESRERMVSRSELIDVVWEGRIVSDAAVSSCIRSARRALDDGVPRRMIQTVHGRGVRFIAEVTEEPSPGADAGGDAVSDPPEPPTRRSDGLALPERRGRPSIAVLPFDNFGASREDGFFAAGLTEEVIANLSRFHDLFVFARSTTAALTGTEATSGALRERFGADFVIEGSVRKSETHVRVTFQLIDTATDGPVLVERFDRECALANVFDIQDRIALLIAARVANRRDLMDDLPRPSARPGRPALWETYRAVARYYEYIRIRDPGLHACLRDDLRQTVERDPDASDAWAALAVVLLDQYRFPVRARGNRDALNEAHRHARRAVSLDPDNAFAYQALAMVQFYRGEFENFLGSVGTSIARNPGKADALAEFGYCFYMAGQIERALSFLDRSFELNPLEDGIPRLFRAGCFFMQDRIDDAMREIGKSPMPGAYWYHAYLIAICHAAGKVEKAEKEAAGMRKRFPNFMTDRLAMNEILCVSPEVDAKFAKIWALYLS